MSPKPDDAPKDAPPQESGDTPQDALRTFVVSPEPIHIKMQRVTRV